MIKQQFLDLIATKEGFVRVVSDNLAPDSPTLGNTEKYQLTIETVNDDGTGGIVVVTYLRDKITDETKFYNVEPKGLKKETISSDQVKLNALQDYLKGNFNAFFVVRTDLVNNWAEADVFTLAAGKLTQSKVLVYKQGTSPVSHIEIV